MQISDYISASYIKNCYKNTSLSKSKSSKKLASGYRINTAADDAAKLSISEKMRAQIRGLDQASNNIQDSISLLQVADGALETVSAITQRIRELAVQAANDTYTDQDRDQMQQECNQLQAEMFSVFNQTTFHSQLIYTGPGILRFEKLTTKEIDDQLLQNKLPIVDSEQMIDGEKVPAEIINFLAQALRVFALAKDLYGKCDETTGRLNLTHAQRAYYVRQLLDLHTFLRTKLLGYNEKWSYKQQLEVAEKNLKLAIGKEENGESSADELWEARRATVGICLADNFATYCIVGMHEIIYALSETGGHIIQPAKYHLNNVQTVTLPTIYDKLDDTTLPASVKANLAGTSLLESLKAKEYDSGFEILNALACKREISLSLQNGPNANQGFRLKVVIPNIPKNPFELSSHSSANKSIDRADQFLTHISAARAEIGACQNRLESALSYTAQGAESLQDSESRMRDANMAKETADYLKTKLQNEFQLSFLAQKNESHTDLSVFKFPE